MGCPDWDSGFCYAPGTKYVNGCVGEDDCEYRMDDSRQKVVNQNGNDGEIYLVEAVARVMAGEAADQILMGKNSGKRRWQLHIEKALAVIEIVREWDK